MRQYDLVTPQRSGGPGTGDRSVTGAVLLFVMLLTGLLAVSEPTLLTGILGLAVGVVGGKHLG